MTHSPERQPEEAPAASTAEEVKADNQDNTQTAHKGPRKRTKTGCLTCRKRRIKCGEEKPICSNCTKSKRHCEGYNNPHIAFRQHPSGFGHTDYAFNARPPLISHFESSEGYNPAFHHLNTGASNQSLRAIAPTPQQVHQHSYYAARDLSYVPPGAQISPALAGDSFLAGPPSIPHSAGGIGTFGTSSTHILRHPSIPDYDARYQPWTSALSGEHLQDRAHLRRSDTLGSSHPVSSAANPQIPSGTFPMDLPAPLSASQFSSPLEDMPALTPTQIAALSDQPLPSGHPFYSEARAHIHDSSLETVSMEHDPKRYTAQGFVHRPSFNTSIPIIASPPPVPASQVEYEEEEDEDDPFDVEMETEEGSVHPSEQSRKDLNSMLIRHVAHDEHRGIRSFTTFLNQKNVLAAYRPSHAALPQADEKAARIFCHFVSSTGPSMTIFERFATPQPGVAGDTAISSFQQPLWTYTLPSLALHHPPLMHAMLALSALHISKLQQTSPGPSIKHFTYALRRVGRLIGLPKRRNEPTTLAANLLLGFYEVMSAETSKWNIHLSGARVLVMEIDFAGKTRKIRALRAQAKDQLAQLSQEHHSDYMRYSRVPECLFPDRDWDVDEDLISTLTGFHVRYDFQYQTNISQPTHQNLEFTAKDVELYKMQADLYWWYCKQDIFQSMLSGNRLLMRYDHWTYCPPRGQIGQLDQVYATMDHLCLIMARLADFGGKDQPRKRRVAAAQGPQASQSAAQTQNPQRPPPGPPPGQGPPMGYMPENPVSMPSAFVAMSANLYQSGFPQQPFSVNSESDDLEAETTAAHAEYAAIAKAFDIFEQCLPEEFGPLPPDAAPPISTPFGPALQYRTHTIACIWTLYYSGCILLRRLHPAMPPAAMISAQAGAAKTAPFAQKIGKICAGLYYPQQYNLQIGALNPSLGGALIESTFALFFAAVQFTDHAQRGWTINKLKEIARLSGWQTAAAVAAGCEFAWEATGRAGRGPPYRPTMDWRSKDDRVGDKVLKNADKAAKAAQKEREREERAKEKEQRSREENEERERERKEREREEQYFIAAGKDGPRRRKTSTIKKIRRKVIPPGKEGEENNGRQEEFEEYEEEVEEEDEDAEPEAITHDRKTIGHNPFARTHWALGLLAVEEDIAKIDLGK